MRPDIDTGATDFRLNLLGIRLCGNTCQLIGKYDGQWTAIGPRWQLPVRLANFKGAPGSAQSFKRHRRPVLRAMAAGGLLEVLTGRLAATPPDNGACAATAMAPGVAWKATDERLSARNKRLIESSRALTKRSRGWFSAAMTRTPDIPALIFLMDAMPRTGIRFWGIFCNFEGRVKFCRPGLFPLSHRFSAGGLEPLKTFFAALPPIGGMSLRGRVAPRPGRHQHAARDIAQGDAAAGRRARDGATAKRGHVYVAPGAHYLKLERGKLKFSRSRCMRLFPAYRFFLPVPSPRTFTSARSASSCSGTGSDGTLGMTAIRAAAHGDGSRISHGSVRRHARQRCRPATSITSFRPRKCRNS